jgi:hypothetical protein
MYSCSLFPGFCLLLRSSRYLPRQVYVPWKLRTKKRHRSVQSLLLSRGRCYSHVRVESPS